MKMNSPDTFLIIRNVSTFILYSTDQAVSGRAGVLLLHHALAVGGRQVRAGRGRAVGGRHHLRLPPADQPLVQMLTTETG